MSDDNAKETDENGSGESPCYADTPQCGNCKFWAGKPDDDYNDCRRYAPQPVTFHYVDGTAFPVGESYMAKWPQVDQEHWCGEHAPVP